MPTQPDETPSPAEQQNQNGNQRVEPTFFGHPSIYQNSAMQKKKDTTAPPPTENPYWANPPPPYSSAPNEPESSNSSDAAGPSAPPLELPFTPHIQHLSPQTQAPSSPSTPTTASDYPPSSYQNQQQQQQPQQQAQNYPPQGYGYYGAVNQQHPYVNPNITTSDANLPTVNNWPWIAPPSANNRGSQQPLMVYPMPPPPSSLHSPLQQHPYYNPDKKQKSCFESFLKYVFYFFCICLVIRLISLLSGGVSYADSCSHGFIWRGFPEHFDFNKNGLRIRTVGGNLSGGHIRIKRISDAAGDQLNPSAGLVKATALVSPASLADNPELNYSLVHLDNGSTTLEIYIPHDLSSRACISLNAVIYIPDELDFVQLDVQNTNIETDDQTYNVGTISFATTNSAIEFDSKWIGKVLDLQTTNARIEINQAIEDVDDVLLTTTNGGVRFRQPVLRVSDTIAVRTSNAGIDADSLLEAPAVQLVTTNGHINVEGVQGLRAEFKTTNSRMEISHANVSQVINAQTTNGGLTLRAEEGNHVELVARTSNSQIYLLLPAEHEGRFEIETSNTNKIEFVDPLGWSQIIYNKGYIAGNRYNPESSTKPDSGHVQVKTSNANIHVHYADYNN